MKSSKKLNELYSHFQKNKKTIDERLSEFKAKKTDREIFFELCFCILAANTSSKMASRVVEGADNILIESSYEELNKRLKELSCRFYNRRSEYIFYARNVPIKFDREYLVKNIKGLGYKESSHFLRNIGFSDYAILDKHILRSLHEFRVIDELPKSLNRKRYLEIEEKMKIWSKEINIPMNELDLVLWSRKTGEVLK